MTFQMLFFTCAVHSHLRVQNDCCLLENEAVINSWIPSKAATGSHSLTHAHMLHPARVGCHSCIRHAPDPSHTSLSPAHLTRACPRPRPMFQPVPMPRPLPDGPSRFPGIAPGMMIGGDYDRLPLVPGNMFLPGQGMGGGLFRQAGPPGINGGMFGAGLGNGLHPLGGRRGSRSNPPGLY